MPAAPEPPTPSPAGPSPAGGALPPEAGALTLPNAITLARLCAVPVTLWLILQHRLDWAFFLFAAAGLSDGLDGWLARRWRSRSALGALLDPVADKALLVTTYLALTVTGLLPLWLTALVVARDLLIMGGVLLLGWLGRPPRIAPLWISKANTLAQILLAGLALLLPGFGLDAGPLLPLLILGVAATTLASGLAYLWQALREGLAW